MRSRCRSASSGPTSATSRRNGPRRFCDRSTSGNGITRGALLALVIRFLDFGSIGWGLDAAAKVAAAVPLLLGAVIGWIGLKRWPGRVVEVALAALAAALVLGGLV
jgi:VIT1/CCC1 family predicted Fe2+/Mn2+ transporter